jgi:hypothetical protein
VEDLDAAIGKYQRAYGLSVPVRQEDPAFGARLAWFEGTPVVLAAPNGPQSWLAERLHRFGETPCAFILGRTGNILGLGNPSTWFGKRVVWMSPDALGWRLGVE